MQIWYINLDRRLERNTAVLKNLEKFGVPTDRIQRLQAKDRDAYDSYDALAADAVEDGFSCFRTTKMRHKQIHGHTWSYLRALRDVAAQSETVMLMEDDQALKITYQRLQSILAEIPDFNIAMLTHSRIRRICPDFSEHWVTGIPASGTTCNILKPEGARWYLDTCMQAFPKTPETVLRDFYPECPGGVYALKEAYREDFIKEGGWGSDIDTPTMYNGEINPLHKQGGSGSNEILKHFGRQDK